MDTPTANLNNWTTEELLGEVLSRRVGDRAELNRDQVTTIRAILNDYDEGATRSIYWHAGTLV